MLVFVTLTVYNEDMSFQERYNNLNNRQKEAVDTIDGPVMVIAGPGTGKTELLSMRVANILKQTDTLPENILCLTYTDNGADAMRRRLISIIGKDAYKVAIHTFHSFGSEVIGQHRQYFYNGAIFQAADNVSTYEILRKIFRELPLSDPLSSMMNDEYAYQGDVKSTISDLKKSGLTSAELITILDDNDVTIEQAERLLAPIVKERVSKKIIPLLQDALSELQSLPVGETKYQIPPLMSVIVESLGLALSSDNTPPISAWKSRFFEKDENNNPILKARKQQKKLRTVAWMYDRYMSEMQAAGLYDYDDMILQVVHSVEVNDDLRFNLQEKYQYLLVDEFQDTNLSQLRIIASLTDNPVNEGRPNIFIVGDDDQAIYSFQGADLSNILNFEQMFTTTKRIVLKDNYRSSQAILDSARSIITQGTDRLENQYTDLSKELTAIKASESTVTIAELESAADEREWIARQVKNLILNDVRPNNIAVLLHKHKDIEALLPFFAKENIAVSYERRDNIFDLEPVVLLERVGRLVTLLASNRHNEADDILLLIISHPAWGFGSQDIWNLSLDAYDKRRRMFEEMEATPAFVTFREGIVELVTQATYLPLELALDKIIGVPSEDGSVEAGPLYRYFFSAKKRSEDPTSYLIFIEALRTLRTKLMEYHPGEPVTLASFIEFIELHRRIGDRLQLRQTVGEGESSVNIMTAHSAKGLEFEHVFVSGVTDTKWGQKARGRSRFITYPENLSLAPEDQSYSERLRLFYVALTRAKSHLTISYSTLDDNNKPVLAASFLAVDGWKPQIITGSNDVQHALSVAETAWYMPLLEPSHDLHALLLPRLERYRLSATHLNTFVDVTRGGPQNFLISRLLHFPSARNAHACYGLAIHSALERAHTDFLSTGMLKPIEDTIVEFEKQLQFFRLEQIDFDAYLQKGSDELTAYLSRRQQDFSPTQKAEFELSNQQSMLGDAKLGGVIDLVDINKTDRTIRVFDYKTGKPATSWSGSTEPEKIRLYKYRQQLLFYKLLIEGSRDYSTYTVTDGTLEYVEPTPSGAISAITTEFEASEVERFKLLVTAVWEHITALNLPDTSQYDQTLKGIIAFENDLIDNVL